MYRYRCSHLYIYSVQSLVLRVGSLAQQPECHLGDCCKCKFVGLMPDLLKHWHEAWNPMFEPVLQMALMCENCCFRCTSTQEKTRKLSKAKDKRVDYIPSKIPVPADLETLGVLGRVLFYSSLHF